MIPQANEAWSASRNKAGVGRACWLVAAAIAATMSSELVYSQTAEELYREIRRSAEARDVGTAEAAYAELQRRFPRHDRVGCAAFALGRAYAQAGDVQKAEAEYRKVAGEYPGALLGDGTQVAPLAMFYLADLLRKQQRGDEAKALYQELLETYPDAAGPGGQNMGDVVRRVLGRQPEDREAAPAAAERRDTDYAGELDFLWRQVRDTYPYFEDKQIDWNAVGDEMRRRVQTIGTDADFVLVCKEMVQRLEDSHCSVQPIGVSLPRDSRRGCGLALAAFGRNEAIVLRVVAGGKAEQAGCRPGWVLTHIDGTPVTRRVEEERLMSRRGFSTPWAAWYRLIDTVTSGQEGTTAQLTFRLPDGAKRTVEVERTGERTREEQWIHPPGTHEGEQVDYAIVGGDTAYVHVRSLMAEGRRGSEPNAVLRAEFEEAIGALGATRRAVLDLRGNSGGNSGIAKWLLGHFVDVPLGVPRWGTIEPQSPPLWVRTAVLIDSGLISTGDQIAAMCQPFPQRFPLLGKPTTGSSGEPVKIEAPSGLLSATISSRRVVDHTGFVIEGRGVQPHLPLDWRPADLARGEDSFINQAIEYLTSSESR
jgi:C-terminal processing protease CtpA/Prc